jgi:hypothetical protein
MEEEVMKITVVGAALVVAVVLVAVLVIRAFDKKRKGDSGQSGDHSTKPGFQ